MILNRNSILLCLVLLLAICHSSSQHNIEANNDASSLSGISIDVETKTKMNSEQRWTEPHDALWKKRVSQLRQFLTPQSRESLRHDIEVVVATAEQQFGWRGLRASQIENGPKRSNPDADASADLRDLQVVNPDFSLNVLVCLVQWSNHADRPQALPVEDVRKLFTGEGRDADLYPGGSVKSYFDTISYGKFDVNFEVTDWIASEYTEQQFTGDGSQGRTQELQQAFEPILQYLDDDFYKFKDHDNNFDRAIDLTIFLHSGYDGSIGAKDCETDMKAGQRIASHARTGADFSEWRSRAGYKLGAYAVAPAFRETCGLKIGQIGTIIHEMIHPFGIPDLYDMEAGYGTGNIGGIDRFGVMANPSGNAGSDLAWPGHVSGWTRQELGWIEPTVIDKDGTYELKPIETNDGALFRINQGFANNKEYLLLENRQAMDGDFDEKFFAPGGILIYHVDENIWNVFEDNGNQGNYPRGGPFQDQWPGNGRHYPVALLQADGLYELEQGINGGGSTDLWNSPEQVLGPGNGEKKHSSEGTYPNTDSYAFGKIWPTGITIRNFQTKGEVVTFEVCGLSGKCSDKPGQDSSTSEKKNSKAGLGVGLFFLFLILVLGVLGWIYRAKVKEYLSKFGKGSGVMMQDDPRRRSSTGPAANGKTPLSKDIEKASEEMEEQEQPKEQAKFNKSKTTKTSKEEGKKDEKPKSKKTEDKNSTKTKKAEDKAASKAKKKDGKEKADKKEKKSKKSKDEPKEKKKKSKTKDKN